MNRETAQDDPINKLGGIVVQVAGPALAILVVSSIASFLIEIFYQSAHVDRVKWIFLLFSFAAVLISRISIEEGFERASFFGLLLGVAILLTSSRLLQGNPVWLVGILSFVWWSAGRLTWDCTFIDKTRDSTGKGMIDLAIERANRFRGIQASVDEYDDRWQDDLPPDPDLVHGLPEQPTSEPTTAWSRFVAIFWKRKQANTPGLWAFYFLLMGLPFFGFGQILLRTNDQQGHQAAAWHFFCYVVGLLGLMMLSSVLGLHRYLQKNNATMPVGLARKWIIAGLSLALAITGFCFLLPRPTPQHSFSNWAPKLFTRNSEASDLSAGEDGQQQSENNTNANSGPNSRDDRSSSKPEGDERSSDGNTRKSENGAPKDTKGGDSSGGKSNDGKKGGGGNKKDNSRENQQGKKKQNRSEGGKKGKNNKPDPGKTDQKRAGEQEKKQDESSEKKSGKEQNLRTRNERDQKPKSSDRKKKKGSTFGSKSSGSKKGTNGSSNKKQQKPREQKPKSALQFMGAIFKLICWIAALLVFGWFLIKYREKILPWFSSFMDEMRELWNRLWNRKPKPESQVEAPTRQAATVPQRKLPRFAEFKNPFATNDAATWDPTRLVSYSFEAFEAWSRDHQCPRDPDQTALEFAKATIRIFTQLDKEAKYLAGLYGQIAYGEKAIKKSSAMALSPLWEKLTMLYAPKSDT